MELGFDQYSPFIYLFLESKNAKLKICNPVGLADYFMSSDLQGLHIDWSSHCIGNRCVHYNKD